MALRDVPFRRQVRHIHPAVHDPRTSAVRRQIARDFGVLAPPFALHLPAPQALHAYWAMVREPTWGPLVDRTKKEAVAAAVSAINTCPYCVDVHTTMLDALGDRAPAAAILSAATDDIADPELRAVVAWARANRQPDTPLLRQPPFPNEHAPELIGVALSYHYINRMINIFAVASPFPLADSKLKPIFKRAALPVFRRLLARKARPGASLDLLPPTPLPDDLDWARPNSIIADAFGRAAAAFDAIGRQALPEPVRQLVTARLSTWRGEEQGISRSWTENAIETLPAPQRPLGRFALLAALASHQVDGRVLNDARTHPGPAGDEALVAAAGWASFAAARRIGSWLHPAPATPTP
ncbi:MULTISPECIES: carboxymuconolactone decarboxylase family protein [unclassified Micromonospora]|uniref:carboxymuconolactone decarboxylase family protein n=1 Tax=unclassified Micromonospora TaxID=2617518 RepID=UPI0033BCA1CA